MLKGSGAGGFRWLTKVVEERPRSFPDLKRQAAEENCGELTCTVFW